MQHTGPLELLPQPSEELLPYQQNQMPEVSKFLSPPPKGKTFAEFLQNTAPDQVENISDLFEVQPVGGHVVVVKPDIFLYCDNEACEGHRFFACTTDTVYVNQDGWKNCFIGYRCRNCRHTYKLFALTVLRNKSVSVGKAMKYGEAPPFGPHVPARLITLIGPDRELFLRGLRAERRGLGIGAFAYYRRVVENEKGRIIGEISRVAAKLGAKKEILSQIDAAAKETQFSKAVDAMKDAIPNVLFIEGRNPLTILHGALSEGLHTEDDETCLELAQSIRLVLTELAERSAQILKEQAELKEAVNKLLQRKSPGTSTDEKAETLDGSPSLAQ